MFGTRSNRPWTPAAAHPDAATAGGPHAAAAVPGWFRRLAPSGPPRRRLVPLAIVTLLAAAVVGGGLLAARSSHSILVRRWHVQLEAMQEPAAIEASLRQMVELGEPGQLAVVRQLGNPRPEVTDAAHRVLDDRLRQWRRGSPDATLDQLAGLASQLAAAAAGPQADHWPVTGRRAAADLAAKLVQWPLPAGRRESTAILAHAEAVLRNAPPWPLEQTIDAAPPPAPAGRSPVVELPAVRERPDTTADVLVGERKLPGEPWQDATQAPEDDVRQEPEPPAKADPNGPAAAAPPPRLLPLDPAGESVRARPLSERQAPDDQAGGALEAPTAEATQGKLYDQLSELELMQLLRWGHAQEAQWAEQQLRQRGYTPLHLALAHRLVDPDPEVRRQLAEQLPGTPRVDVRPWLLHLSRDEDPRVRMTAVTIIATSGDARLLEALQELQQQEDDPAIISRIRSVLDRR